MIPALLLAASLAAASQGDTHVRRYLLSAGANNGGKDRVMLRYAVSDARAFAAVLMEMGGVEKNNALVLANPNSRELLGGIANLGKLIAGEGEPDARSEVFVYYSGHADDNGLKLGSETLPWAEFRNAVSGLNADVRVAVLDACGSGAITRAKGGVARPAFLSDASSNMKGYAFLTSSNENEASQESDRIKGSYFTHALLNGMRGAADMTGDGKVTINEAYQYAFNETLQSTQNTRAGTQHPSRDMNLAGTGDVVMTDLRETSATLLLDANIDGRFFIRDEQGNLFAELRKARGRAIELGMPPGKYSVQMEAPSKMWMANEIEIAEGKKTTLTMNDMKAMETKATVARGDGGDEDAPLSPDSAENSRVSAPPEDSPPSTASAPRGPQPFLSLPLSSALDPLPPLPPNPNLDSACRSPFRLNSSPLSTYSDAPESGVQLSFLMNHTRAEFCGTQSALVLNMADKDMNGAQGALVINVLTGSGNVVQTGLMNAAFGSIMGMQAGVVNVAGGATAYIQGGGFNLAKRVEYVQAGSANIAGNVGYVQGGAFNLAGKVGYIQGGSFNVAGSVGYFQGGAFNIAGNVGYLQGGSFNIAGEVGQIQAGAFNIAGKVRRQIGVVNIAGYSEKTPIGLVNIIGNGIFDASFYANMRIDELSLALRTGTPWLYTLFEYGQPRDMYEIPDAWPKYMGWGLGTRFGMTTKFFLNLDAAWLNIYTDSTLSNIFNDKDESENWFNDNYYKTRLGANYSPLPFLAVTGGIGLNAAIEGHDGKIKLKPSGSSEWKYRGHNALVWPELYLGLTLGKIQAKK
jgi:uncharacterized membrane protein